MRHETTHTRAVSHFRLDRGVPSAQNPQRNAVDSKTRCTWARTPLSVAYHDAEWGVPVHDDAVLFEFLTLEGAQAGLSWETILKKRAAYREAFLDFAPDRVARFTPARVERLLLNAGLVRNRLKIESTVRNARAFLAIQQEFGSFDAYVWGFAGGAPRVNRRRALDAIPARTAESDALSRDLLRRGFKFVGSTICYAFMQAVGLVNDHTTDCFRYPIVGQLAGRPLPDRPTDPTTATRQSAGSKPVRRASRVGRNPRR
jgi:DNA-3-methyladenine glycosylase I